MHLTKTQASLHKFASSSRIRPELHCVFLKDDGLTAVATDSSRLVEVTRIPDLGTPEDYTTHPAALITSSSLKAMKIRAKDTVIEIDITHQTATPAGNDTLPGPSFPIDLYTDATTKTNPADPSDYPKYQSVIDGTDKLPHITLKLNAKMLAEILTTLAALTKHNDDKNNPPSCVTLQISTVPLKPLIIRAESPDEKAVALLMPLQN